METDETPGEDFAQLLARLKADYGIRTDSEIARRIDVSPAAVGTWVHRKRTPRPEAIRRLHEAYPRFSEAEMLAAAGRVAPGPLSANDEEEVLALFRRLTVEQQEISLVQLRALGDSNR